MSSVMASILGRPRAVLAFMVATVIAGFLAYTSIAKDANPDIDVPVFYVAVTQIGISPEDSVRLLVRPLENKLRGLDGLKEIRAIASEGHAGIILEFNIDFDKDKALADVRAAVDQARAELPAEAEAPQVIETNFSLIPTLVVALSGDVPQRTLYTHARQLKEAIERVPSVLEAKLVGSPDELLEIVINQSKLESYGFTQEQVINAVLRNNRLVPAGAIDTGNGRFNVKVPGLFERIEDVLRLPLKTAGDAVVTLSDVAEVRRTFKDPNVYYRVNGKPAIAIEAIKRLGQNVIVNNEAVRQAVREASAGWPQALKVDFLLDESSYITEVLASLEANVIFACLLVLIVTFAAIDFRSSILIGLAIPVSFLSGFLLLQLIGMTVNIMVLFSLIVTAGIVVDGATVVVEYANRRIAEGLDRRTAFTLAAQKMFWPVAAGTGTTLAAFMPMVFWPGVAGEFMSYLPTMVILVLAASIVTALMFVPALAFVIAPTTVSLDDQEQQQALAAAARGEKRRLKGFTALYTRIVSGAVAWPGTTAVVIIGIVVASFWVFIQSPTGVQFFVEDEPERAVVLISARGNLSAAEQRDLAIEVERQVMQVKGVKTVITSSGQEPGGERLGDVQDRPPDMIAQLTLELSAFRDRRDHKQIFAEIRERTGAMAGLRVEVRKLESGPPTGKAIRLQVSGDDYAAVRDTVGRIRAHVDTLPGLIDREDSRPLPGIEWQVRVDREQAARFGADIASLGTMVQLVTNGVLVGTYRPDDADDTIDIRVRLPEAERSIDRLDQLSIMTPNGLVPLGNMVTRVPAQQVSSISRTDGRFSMFVKSNVEPGILSDDKVQELTTWLKTQEFPAGVQWRFRGADEDQKESQAFLQGAMLASLFMMFLILVIQYNSFFQVALTLSTVVMSVGGVMLGMWLTGQPFSVIMTGIGVLALAGVVVNNAIILTDTYNEKVAEGIDPPLASILTAAERMRPVLLTTATTVVGLVPNALQLNIDLFSRETQLYSLTSMWWVQMSTAIISGLTFATILTLLFVPAMLSAGTVWGRMLGLVPRKPARPLTAPTSGADPAPANDREGVRALPQAAE